MHRIAEAMRGVWRFALALAVVALLVSGLAACGGDDAGSSTAVTTGESTTPATAEKQGPGGDGGDDSSADRGSAGFRTPGGDNSIQTFGEEADDAEVAAASVVLVGYLEARSEEDWAGQCTYLAKAAVAPLEELVARSPQFKGKGCAAALPALMAGTPASTRANTLTGTIASLRVEGDRGFALYHGADGVDYFVPMAKEDGEWKLGAIAPSEFP
jgi:hypothetical protein